MNLKWWEKTVEYKFVMLLSQANKLFLAPLDGDHERAGDAIFSNKNKWVLIEFKKDKKSIWEEKAKFQKYEIANKELQSCDGHHHLVYGQLNEKEPQKLDLCCETYFSGRGLGSLGEILSSGTSLKQFSDYIKKFTEYKRPPKGSSSGGLTINDYALVAGVNNDNQVVECVSLAEFQLHLGLELHHERQLTKDRSGPTR